MKAVAIVILTLISVIYLIMFLVILKYMIIDLRKHLNKNRKKDDRKKGLGKG